MNANTKRILAVGGMLSVCVIIAVSWTIVRTIPWLVLDGDAISTALGQAMTESYHAALRDGDATVQLQVLEEQFAPAIRQNDEGAVWIRTEFRDDVSALVDSDDPSVSNAASKILSMFDAEPVPPDGG